MNRRLLFLGGLTGIVSLLLFLFIGDTTIPLEGQIRIPTPEENYRWYCTQCHGLSGQGNGVNSRDMPITPRDHTDKTDPEKQMHKLTDKDLFETIKFGGPSRKKSNLMPGWEGVLSDAEINGLVKYLRELCCTE